MKGRRDQILDAALACFNKHGYEGTTIEQIREHSGASTGSIYHHFAGKEQLADALYTEALRNYQEGFLTLLGPDVERSVKGVVRHHLRWVDSNPQPARFLLSGRPSEAVRDLNRAAFEQLEHWRSQHAHELQPLSFDAFYAVVIGPAQEAARHRLAGRTRTPLRRLERELADAAWRAIRGGSR